MYLKGLFFKFNRNKRNFHANWIKRLLLKILEKYKQSQGTETELRTKRLNNKNLEKKKILNISLIRVVFRRKNFAR